jgi:selenium-binding protein 1
MTVRPDPTFHATAKLAMEAPPERYAYTLMLSPDFSQPDGLVVVDVDPGSENYGRIVHTVMMPNRGDEFHHFGWNACSSALSPLMGHAFFERRYLVIPGIRSSRIYVIDTKPEPTRAAIHKIIEPEEVFRKTGYSRPHTIHCGPEGIYVSTLGGRPGRHRWPTWYLHYRLRDLRSTRPLGDRPWPAGQTLRFLVEPAA